MTSLFQKRVYKVVQKIPKRSFLTYKKVAEKAGYPRAWRAVGNVLNKNQDPEIPCHRVIRSDGKVGGYKNGAKEKIEILKKEGVIIVQRKIALPRRRISTRFSERKSNIA